MFSTVSPTQRVTTAVWRHRCEECQPRPRRVIRKDFATQRRRKPNITAVGATERDRPLSATANGRDNPAPIHALGRLDYWKGGRLRIYHQEAVWLWVFLGGGESRVRFRGASSLSRSSNSKRFTYYCFFVAFFFFSFFCPPSIFTLCTQERRYYTAHSSFPWRS